MLVLGTKCLSRLLIRESVSSGLSLQLLDGNVCFKNNLRVMQGSVVGSITGLASSYIQYKIIFAYLWHVLCFWQEILQTSTEIESGKRK